MNILSFQGLMTAINPVKILFNIFIDILGLIEVGKSKSNFRLINSLNENQDRSNNIDEVDYSTDIESSGKSVVCVCNRSSCFSF